jgi:hypothetical protein
MRKCSPALLRVGFNSKWKPVNRFISNECFVTFFHHSLLVRRFLLRYLRRQKLSCSFGVITYNYGTWFVCIYLYNRLRWSKFKKSRIFNKYKKLSRIPVKNKKVKFIRKRNFRVFKKRGRWHHIKVRRFYTRAIRNFMKKKYHWLNTVRVFSRYRLRRKAQFLSKRLVFAHYNTFLYFLRRRRLLKKNKVKNKTNMLSKSYNRWSFRVYSLPIFVYKQYLNKKKRFKKRPSFTVASKRLRSKLNILAEYSTLGDSFRSLYTRNRLRFGTYGLAENNLYKSLVVNSTIRSKFIRFGKSSVGRGLNKTLQFNGLQPYLLKLFLSKGLYGVFTTVKFSFVFVWLQKYRLKLWRFLGLRMALKSLGGFRRARYALNMLLIARLALVLRRPDLFSDYLNVMFRRVRLGQSSLSWCLHRCFKYFIGFTRFSRFHIAMSGRFGRSTRTGVRVRALGHIPYSYANSNLSYSYGSLVSRFGIFGLRLCWRYLRNTQRARNLSKPFNVKQNNSLYFLSSNTNSSKQNFNIFFLKHQERLKKNILLKRSMSKHTFAFLSGKRKYRLSGGNYLFFTSLKSKLFRQLLTKKVVRVKNFLMSQRTIKKIKNKNNKVYSLFFILKLTAYYRKLSKNISLIKYVENQLFSLYSLCESRPDLLNYLAFFNKFDEKKPSRLVKLLSWSERSLPYGSLSNLSSFITLDDISYFKQSSLKKQYYVKREFKGKTKKMLGKLYKTKLVSKKSLHKYIFDNIFLRKRPKYERIYKKGFWDFNAGPRPFIEVLKKKHYVKFNDRSFNWYKFNGLFVNFYGRKKEEYYIQRALSIFWHLRVLYRWEALIWSSRILDELYITFSDNRQKSLSLNKPFLRNRQTTTLLGPWFDTFFVQEVDFIDFFGVGYYELLGEFGFFSDSDSIFDVDLSEQLPGQDMLQ